MSFEASGSRNAARSALPGGWLAQLAPFAILMGTAMYLRLRWDEIPSRFAVHWGINGRPNGWSERTPAGVYEPLILGAAVILLVSASSYGVRRLARPGSAPATGSLTRDFKQRTGIFLLILEVLLAVIFSLVGLLPLTGNPGVPPVLIATGAMLLALISAAAWLAKNRTEYARSAAAPVGVASLGGSPDRYWKLGTFYCNPDDTAVFVEKRSGLGYTLNFAHPSAWIIVALTLLLPLGLLFALHRR
jgi:uncharacterized membrane protein